MEGSIVQRINQQIRSQYDQAIQYENAPIGKRTLGKIPIRNF